MVNEMMVLEERRGQDTRHSTWQQRAASKQASRGSRGHQGSDLWQHSTEQHGSGPALCSSGRHVAVLFFVFCF